MAWERKLIKLHDNREYEAYMRRTETPTAQGIDGGRITAMTVFELQNGRVVYSFCGEVDLDAVTDTDKAVIEKILLDCNG